MLIKYNGEYTRETRAYGCSKCGTGRSINGRAVYKTSDRTYYEGRLYIFKQDEPVEVDEIEKITGTASWDDKFSPEMCVSPIAK